MVTVAGKGCGQSPSSVIYYIRRLIDAKHIGVSHSLGAFVATQMLVEVGGGISRAAILTLNASPKRQRVPIKPPKKAPITDGISLEWINVEV